MPHEIEKQSPLDMGDKKASPFFVDAYNFCKDTIDHPDARARQAYVAAYGGAIGGMKTIQQLPEQFAKHPVETIINVAKSSIPALAGGAVVAALTPEILEAAAAVGIATTAMSLWHTCVKLTADKYLQRGMDAAYKSDDPKTINKSINIASEVLGPEAAEYGIQMASSLTGLYGSKVWRNLRGTELVDKLHPFIPERIITRNGAVEMHFKDRSALHLHEDQAIYQVGGLEFPMHANYKGVDMSIMGSIAGRHVIKGWQLSELNQPLADVFSQPIKKPFKVDINPDFRTTKVTSHNKTLVFQHPESGEDDSLRRTFVNCLYCEPFNPNI